MLLVIEILGVYLVYLQLLILVIGLFMRRYRPVAVIAFISASVSAILGWFLKNNFYLPRPYIFSGHLPVLPYLLDGAFPSNHTAVAVAVSITVFLRHRIWGLAFGFMAILVAAGRIIGGVHSFFDILAGAALGSLVALFVEFISARIKALLF
jgi:undecaprenyl-diphosphatase